MPKFALFVFLLTLIVLLGGAVFLATWEIPAPTQNVERVLPDDRFPQ